MIKYESTAKDQWVFLFMGFEIRISNTLLRNKYNGRQLVQIH